MQRAVIVDAVRTPMGKRGGSLSHVHPVDLLGQVLTQLVKRNELDASLVEDVIVGCAGQVDEQSNNIARNAVLAAGLPISVAGVTIDRQCGSSLQAVQFAAQGIIAGSYDVVIAAGVESMSRVPMGSSAKPDKTPMTPTLLERFQLSGYGFNQFSGAETLAYEGGLARLALESYSVQSHTRAAHAQQAGYFDRELIAIEAKTAEGEPISFTADETIRSMTTSQGLAALKPVFEGLQTVTAGTSSQIADGASAILIMSEKLALELGYTPLAVFQAFSVVGTDPVVMLKGPALATEKVLQRASLTLDEIDLIEINEAFASVVLYWQKQTGANLDKVNVNGGAIALGHALGSTGTRLVTTLVHELNRQQKKYGLVTICEGPGMANAIILERYDKGEDV